MKKKYDTESFIEKSRKIHGDKYDYSLVNYEKSDTKVKIICPEHGVFLQIPDNHLYGFGCKECGKKKTANSTRGSLEDFIKKAKKLHGDKYDYSEIISYKNTKTKMKIICKRHGEFFQNSSNHLTGKGCPKCGNNKIAESRKDDKKSFIEKANEVHPNIYDYTLVDYVSSAEKINIICKKHGIFNQIPNSHLRGGGCPNCATTRSQGEIDIFNFVSTLEPNIIEGNRSLLENGKEIDIFIPSKNIAIEFNGLFWHTENNGGKDKNYHLNKTEVLTKKNIRLVHIFEDEWLYKSEIVKSRLKNMLIDLPKIYARKCDIREIDSKTKNEFLEKTHIQGADKASVSVGAFYNGELVAVMTFCKARVALGHKGEKVKNKIELSRFSTISDFRIIGVAGKLLSFYEKNYNPEEIISYADKRWSEGNLYKQIGFEKIHESKPNYWYINLSGKKILGDWRKKFHRFNFARHRLSKIFNEDFPPEKTEWEIMQEKGFDRIWDCGNILFSKKYNNTKKN